MVVAALWIAVDICVSYSRLAFHLAPPPAFIGTFPKLTYCIGNEFNFLLLLIIIIIGVWENE